MTQPFSLAILGCGDLTRRTILPHLALPDARARFRVEGVCDVNLQIARQTAQEFDVAGVWDDFAIMLRECDAEAVLIIVPAALHAGCARQAVRAGRHVYVQKPLAPTVAEADALLSEVAARKATLVAAPGQALWPLHAQLQKLISDGAIGLPYTAHGAFLGWGGYELHHGTHPGWCFAEGSGPLRDHGVYALATLTTLLGPVRRVSALGNARATQRKWRKEVFSVDELDNLALALEFQSGALGTLAESWCFGSDASAAFRVNGLEGVIEGGAQFAGYHGIFPLSATLRRANHEPELLRVEPESVAFLRGGHLQLPNPHVYADLCHLAEVALGECANLADGTRARHIVQILEAAHADAQQTKATLAN